MFAVPTAGASSVAGMFKAGRQPSDTTGAGSPKGGSNASAVSATQGPPDQPIGPGIAAQGLGPACRIFGGVRGIGPPRQPHPPVEQVGGEKPRAARDIGRRVQSGEGFVMCHGSRDRVVGVGSPPPARGHFFSTSRSWTSSELAPLTKPVTWSTIATCVIAARPRPTLWR
jgi:hypothetical protein